MNDHVTMTIIDTRNDLLEELARFRFVKLSLFHNVVEKLATRHKLHHHEDIGGGRYDLIQLDDVRVTKQL